MLEKILNYLRTLDVEPYIPLQETTVSQGIKETIGKTEEKASGEVLYEILAFDLFPRHEGNQSEWGTYFGSMMSGPTDNPSESWEYPSRKQVSKETILYWTKRAREAKHPVLIERYSDAAFDLAKLAGEKPDYTLAQLAIDSMLKVCRDELVEGIYQRQEIHRALMLAMRISDKPRLTQVIREVVDVEQRIAEDDKPGLWGFAFKWLVLDGYEKVEITEEIEQALLNDLEERLERLIAPESPEPWNVECAVNLLFTYYSNKKDDVNAIRVLDQLEDAYRRNARANSDPLLKVNYLEKLDKLYRQNGALPGMKDRIERIAQELPEASKESTSSFKEISAEVKISTSDIEKYINNIFTAIAKDGSKPTLTHIKVRIISNFLEKKEHAEKLAEQLSKKFVFMHIVEQKRLSVEGHTEYVVPPYREDPESHTISQAFQSIQIAHIFLSKVMDRLRSTYSLEEAQGLFSESSLFLQEEKDYFTRGLSGYWAKDSFSASQTFIPYIETLIRRLIAHTGGITLRPNENGGYSNKTLGTLLSENGELIDKIYGAQVSFYLKVVLTHPLGWNLRNNFAHGIGLNALFRDDISDRLFHILLLLSLVKIEKKESIRQTKDTGGSERNN